MSPAAVAAADRVDADDVLAALAREGFPVDLREDTFGDPEIESAMGDTLFDVLFFDCDSDVCDTITFSAAYVSNTVAMEEMNQWNINTLHGQAYLDDEDDPNLDFTILAAGGLTQSNLHQIVRQRGRVPLRIRGPYRLDRKFRRRCGGGQCGVRHRGLQQER